MEGDDFVYVELLEGGRSLGARGLKGAISAMLAVQKERLPSEEPVEARQRRQGNVFPREPLDLLRQMFGDATLHEFR